MMATPASALWTSVEADAATGGYSTGAWQAQGVSIDSRTLHPGDLFIAIKGPKYDAHEFVARALEGGAAAAMVSRIPQGLPRDTPLLIVNDTMKGLNHLARAARARTSAHVIAITGSVGKTSTKEALKAVLAPQGVTAASEGSYNNLWGVPLSLARMPRGTDFGVLEIGMNHPGEITPLSKLARPDTALITTIQGVHTAYFGSLSEIATAKAEIFRGMDGGTAILNRDNAYFDALAGAAKSEGIERIIGFGAGDACEARLMNYRLEGNGSRVEAEIFGRGLSYGLGAPGRHWAMNSLAVLCAVEAAGGDVEAAAKALKALKAPRGRGDQHRVLLSGGAFTLLDESYNASPASMAAAFEVLSTAETDAGGRRIAVLGDMLELGPDSAKIHAALADDLIELGIDLVCTVGKDMVHLHDALPRKMRGGHAGKAEELAPLVRNLVRPGDVVTVKGSRASRMSFIADALLGGQSTPKIAANDN
ncbi:MAG: UDP-N-acetylmuramoylalanyl-D-glutamyl-2,6-diaminopimelate--D-alanyl-D-alanine ligase [Alphaproteobacteria bacterium]